jgi:hypothetical protein
MIPYRCCWKSQEFVTRGILYGDEQRIPLSFCLLRSTVHEASAKIKEKLAHQEPKPGYTIVMKTLDIDSIDMSKKYWVT